MGKKTKDERFMISLYEQQSEVVCPYDLGKAIGQSKKMVQTIIKLLTRSNFVKKHGEDHIVITHKGKELAETLINN